MESKEGTVARSGEDDPRGTSESLALDDGFSHGPFRSASIRQVKGSDLRRAYPQPLDQVLGHPGKCCPGVNNQIAGFLASEVKRIDRDSCVSDSHGRLNHRSD